MLRDICVHAARETSCMSCNVQEEMIDTCVYQNLLEIRRHCEGDLIQRYDGVCVLNGNLFEIVAFNRCLMSSKK